MAIGDFASLERKYTDNDVRTFSGLCGDENPIHLDAAYGELKILRHFVNILSCDNEI